MLTKILMLLLVVSGVIVAILSIYKASVDAYLVQAGLMNSDFRTAIDQEKLSMLKIDRGRDDCIFLYRLWGAIKADFATQDAQQELLPQLAKQRIECGVLMLRGERVEIGTYEVTKGIRYYLQAIELMREGKNREACKNLDQDKIAELVEPLIDSTKGRIREIIAREWASVRLAARDIEPMCIAVR